MSLNKVMLIGNVGKDPEVRYLEQNPQNPAAAPKVASFTLATTERYRDRSGELKENTEWHNIVVWRNNAEICEKYVRKGTQLYVEGRIRSRSWDGQDGVKHYITEIIADNVQLLGRKPDAPQQGGYSNAGAYAPAQQPSYGAPAGYAPQSAAPAGFAPQSAAYAPKAAAPAAAPASGQFDPQEDDLPF